MKKYKITGIGLDLRNPKSKIYGGTDLDVLKKEINYVLLDVMGCNESLTHEFTENMIIHKLADILATLDLSKIPSDPENNKSSLNLAADLWLEWQNGYWKHLGIPKALFVSNLPIEPEKGVAEKVKFKEDIEFLRSCTANLGLYIQDPTKGIEELENWKSVFGKYPEHVLRPISLLQYNKELEDKMNEEHITTWGVDYYGDELSKETEFQAFSNSFLLSFAAYHSSVTLLPVKNGIGAETVGSLRYLEKCLGMELEDGVSPVDPKFEMKKSISRLVKPPKKIIEEGIILGNDWVVLGDNSELQYLPDEVKFFFGKVKEDYTIPEFLKGRELLQQEEKFKDIVSNYFLPDAPEWRDYCWRILTLLAPDCLSKWFREDNRWSMDVVRVGKYSMIINVTQTKKKSWFKRNFPDEVEDLRTFLLCLGDHGNIFFIDTQADMNYITEITKYAPMR